MKRYKIGLETMTDVQTFIQLAAISKRLSSSSR